MAETLFSVFPPLTREDWLQQVAQDLKGKSPDSLRWMNEDGIPLFPILTDADTQALPQGMPAKQAPGNSWLLHHDFVMDSPEAVTALLAQDSGFELDAVGLVLGGTIRRHECAPWPYYFWNPGIAVDDAAAFAKLVAAVPHTAELHVTAGMGTLPVYAALVQALRNAGRDLAQVRGGIDNDPFRFLLKCGTLPFGEAVNFNTQAGILSHALRHLPQFRSLQVNVEPVAMAGGTPAQELAVALGMAVETLTQMQARGISPADAVGQLHFVFAMGSDFFTQVSKLRAFRRLWERIVEGYALKGSKPLYLRAKTSGFTLSHLDPHVNLLRTTTQAMSAIIGGADAVSVAEFDQVSPADLAFSARIARNIQLLLRHESHLDAVADAAGGAYLPEQLTAALEEKAWALFLEWEKEGGFLKAYEAGKVQMAVWQSAEKKEDRILTGKEKLIGVNQFPNAKETSEHLLQMATSGYGTGAMLPVDANVRALAAGSPTDMVEALGKLLLAGMPFTQVVDSLLDEHRTAVPMLPGKRASHDFEMLRRTTESYVMMEGRRPLVALYTFGQPLMRRARASFSQNLFLVGGFAIQESDDLEKLMDARPDVLVFCADDNAYLEHVPAMATQLSGRMPGCVLVLAGKPEGSEEWIGQGLHSRIYAGMEVPSYLVNVQRKLGML